MRRVLEKFWEFIFARFACILTPRYYSNMEPSRNFTYRIVSFEYSNTFLSLGIDRNIEYSKEWTDRTNIFEGSISFRLLGTYWIHEHWIKTNLSKQLFPLLDLTLISQYLTNFRLFDKNEVSGRILSITRFDSEHWKLAQNSISQMFSTSRLKTKIKNRAHLFN